ncbi:Autophagy-related protein 2 [Fulvia fulva]|uniref:Autophagy-related protein 2 n=1 Tax=Passalora fulva TaxID=5499 RepID=A0A9Q8PIS6_PASFU|nr:Autophagy-related protein 2 [Fulvia fulva]KAK4626936.1 Autophagy-related protein 2 [Fulvia fulva]KAK4628361.1 Autophagy-related protein 2 [Fulvia fulva]UJO23165.1 Autophagy-related protein 2 [Fulvia fulva]WPV13813.1 Autophagy-related protein 2 [Fulvia fulva]WPV29010.1 Autophagy-related protein 2 [Fulvia fulva]
MSSWWQKKLLRYALRYVLQRTGLLEDHVIDLDQLDITVGKQSVIELKDVGLNVKQISKKAHLPPSLRLEVARVLSLRLTIPADIHQSSVVVEVDGIEVVARLEEEDVAHTPPQRTQRAQSPATTRTPQHRKTNRRIHSPPPYHPGALRESDDDVRAPTIQHVAKSFLMEEPMQERRQLEAQVAAESQNIEESFVSESSEGDTAGTGTGVGVPGFLSDLLQGIMDRFKLEIRNVEVKVKTDLRTYEETTVPITMRLAIGGAEVDDLAAPTGHVEKKASLKRSIQIRGISVALLSDKTVLSETSGLSSRASRQWSVPPSRAALSPTSSDHALKMAASRRTSSASARKPLLSTSILCDRAFRPTVASSSPTPEPLTSVHESLPQNLDTQDFAHADPEVPDEDTQAAVSASDIRAGDDNVSWGSRRSQSSAPAEDLWKSMVSDDDLPDSFIVDEHRVSTPKVSPSRTNSPLAGRQRRAVSPYDRSIHSPASWPRLEESPQRQRIRQGPGSWPAPDQSVHSTYDPLDQVLTDSRRDENVTDNKRVALELSEHDRGTIEPPPEPQEVIGDDMLESRFYSHEEAQSMYMSAMTGSPEMAMPGGWGSDVQSQRSSSPEVDRKLSPVDLPSLDEKTSRSQHIASGNVTPRAGSPNSPRRRTLGAGKHSVPEMVTELIYVDEMTIAVPVPGLGQTSVIDQPQQPAIPATRQNRNSPQGMPGTFSAYSEMSSSMRRGASSVYGEVNSVLFTPPEGVTSTAENTSVDVAVGAVTVRADFATCKLMHSLSTTASFAIATDGRQDSTAYVKAEPATSMALSFTIQLSHLSVSLRESVDAAIPRDHLDTSTGILDVRCRDIDVASADDTSLRIGDLAVELGGADLLTLKREERDVQASHSTASNAAAISLTVLRNRIGVNGTPVTDVALQTTRARLTFDLEQVDAAFDSFGGLSGVLELGSSFLSESGPTSSAIPKAPKGVRFAGDTEPTGSTPEVKLNARIDGATLLLRAPSCSVELRTSSLKAIYREQGAVATLEHITVSGPCLEGDVQSPLALDLASLRIEYLLTPQDKDLERLLSLLTPSKDKYDTDDDILIDTLLRQRRKGSLLRLAVGDVKLKVDDWQSLQSLTALGDDLTKLSAVTKYLPEDDRPGLLILLRVKDAEAQLPVNDRFGKLRICLQDLHLAQVGLPALLAFSLGTVKAEQVEGVQLLHPLIQQTASDNLPVIMARMLGDEAEPTVKIKVLNLCFEYSVPVILDLTGMDQEMDTEDLVVAVAQSVANLAMTDKPATLERSPGSDVSKVATKKTNIDLLIHDSAIGLTPQKLSSKALVVLSDAHISTTVPPEATVAVKLDMRKASLLITDRHLEDQITPSGPDRVSANYTNTTAKLNVVLQRQGFVSVGSLMSAEISFCATGDGVSDAKSVEVDVKNELFLLETCADSTQTLIATLGALTPPTPPNKVPKYLTEPMPIEDLVNSFTGEALPQPEPVRAAETLFDVEEDLAEDDGLDMPYSNSNLYDEPDDLLTHSALTGSLYGPISGVFGADDVDERESTIGEDYPETAESLLEDDPFEMTNEADVRMGDAALLRDLGRQCKPALSNDVIDVGLYEIEDLGYDALGCGQQALGSQHRFNAPHVGKRGRRTQAHANKIPFRLRLRDFHVIWHLYDGYDWQRTRDGIVEAVEQVELKAEERKARRRQSHNDQEDDDSVIGDFLFNSIYIGVPSDLDAQDLRRQINRGIDEDVSETASIPVSGMSRPTTYSASGGPSRQRQRRRLKLGRSKNHKISFELKGVAADVLVFPPGSGEIVSSVDLRLKAFEIFDKVPTSTWRKFLTHMTNDPRAREMAKPMFHIQLDTVKTLESHSASEFMLHVTVLPIRLHVDQDALDFITRFFEFKDESMASIEPEGERPFIQRVEVDTVDMCLDYKPKKVDYAGIRSGKTSEFMNFITLEAANIRLKRAILYGLNGFEELHPQLNGLWMPDVTRNQLPGVLAGLAPVRSLANLGMGVRDVIAIPVREYQKDGRIVRSIQKGAFQFGKTTASELARLGAKVALGTQTMLSNAEDLLSPPTERSSRPGTGRRVSGEQAWHDVASDDEEPEQRAVSAYANQPLGLLQGLRSARRHLEHDLLTAKDALIAVQGEFLESRGPGDAAAAVVKHAPTVILRPVIGATRAVGTTLLGVGNQIDRNNLRRIDDKYKRR